MRPLSLQSILVMPALAACMYIAPLAANPDGATAQAESKKPSHRSIRQGMFALSQIDFATVVMLGDSLTEGGQWSEITGCPYVANRGIGSDDSAGVVRRLDEVTKLKPSAVFLMIGVNDVASGVPTETIVDNVRQTIKTLTKARAQVYLTLVLPVAQIFTRKINPKITELNAAYVALAKETKATLVDFRSEMRNEDGYLRDELTIDGIHLIPDGYRMWRDAVMPLIAKHCVPSAVPRAVGRPPAVGVANETRSTSPPGEFNLRFGPWR